MDPIYQSALNGTLKSPPPGQKLVGIALSNDLDVPIYIRIVDTQGVLTPPHLIRARSGTNLAESFVGWYVVFTVVSSGAFVCVLQFRDGAHEYRVDTSLLVRPNDVG